MCRVNLCPAGKQGFSLIEMMLALLVMTFGFLAAGQLLYVAAGSTSLARSKGTAVLAAQGVLESLGSTYSRNPLDAELAPGNHGPRRWIVSHPQDGAVLNRYDVSWVVENVSDPRPRKAVGALRVRATVSPVHSGGAPNIRPGLNKILNVITVFSAKTRG